MGGSSVHRGAWARKHDRTFPRRAKRVPRPRPLIPELHAVLGAIDAMRADFVRLEHARTDVDRVAAASDLVFERSDGGGARFFCTHSLALSEAIIALQKAVNRTVGRLYPWLDEPTITPEDTLREAGIDDARQAEYQRKMAALLAGRGPHAGG